MIEIDTFLEPVPGDNVCGQNLYYTPVFDKIREARRQEDTGPMGLWERDRKGSDFKAVIKLGEDALKNKSKDLWLASWLTEAWIYRDGIEGLTAGLTLISALIERYWDQVFPEIEDGDLELRATPLDWLGSYFEPAKGSSPILALRSVPLTAGGLNWFVYEESRAIGYEDQVKGNDSRTKARNAAIAEGKIAPEDFDKDVASTPKAFYRDLEIDCVAATEALERFNELCQERFGDLAPSVSPLRNALDKYANVVHILLLAKLKTDPDPIEAPPIAAPTLTATPDSTGVATGVLASDSLSPDAPGLADGQIGTLSQAELHVIAAAGYIRRQAPASPVSYLLLRALRWGELRAAGENLESLLEAPYPEVRKTIRLLVTQKNWSRVLDAAETAMSTGCGRAWLDLQRYVVQSCEELQYTLAAQAIRSELKMLLLDFPQLPTLTLNDDTGAANPETLSWLRREGLIT